jgi:hypothetical protein
MSGHHPVHTGLQRHSVSESYPLLMVGIANGDETIYEIHNAMSGEVLHITSDGPIRPAQWVRPQAAEWLFDQLHHHRCLRGQFGNYRWLEKEDYNLMPEDRQAMKIVKTFDARSYHPVHGGYPE